MSEQEEYTKMLTDLIQKQMLVLGPKIALDKAKKVAGLSVAEDGRVLSMAGDAQMILKGVANEYMALSGQIAKMTLDTLLEKYPAVKNIAEE
ncbi:MAG: hypothetical protein M1400_01095 [Patescibacteria group bacterium]|nr:hypothetical protein [Patescibacteria group bacterium]